MAEPAVDGGARLLVGMHGVELFGDPVMQGAPLPGGLAGFDDLADLVVQEAEAFGLVRFQDLAGDQPGSWKSSLAAHGVACTAELTGLVEREAFRRLWTKRMVSLG